MARQMFLITALRLPAVLISCAVMAGSLLAQSVTIGGNIYQGAKSGGAPVYAPSPLTPPITNARVMVQSQHSGGAFITYGTITGNSWSATVPAPGDYVVMFSAPGYDNTSREFTVDAAGNVTNPAGTGATQDAYLPPLPLPKANLLVYAFYDYVVNGEPDVGDGDQPLNGVTFYVRDEDGNLLATGVTGSQPIITTTDDPPVVITNTDGLYYFTNLPPGEVIVTSDASTVTAAANPHITFAKPDATREWYLNYTEEGGPAWDPKLMPGDPGTEDGGFLIWHSYVEKLGQLSPSPNAGSISGTLVDADKANLDPDEPFPIPGEDHPGVTLNDRVPEGLVILFTDQETVPPHPVATVEADPITGDFTFVNVPPGKYKMMMFDKPLDYVWTQQQVTVAPNQNVVFPLNSLLVPRFFARIQGYVYDSSTNLPMAGRKVHIRYKDGSIQKTVITDANGWYNFDDMPEIEVIGYVDVELPAGYRGTIRTETFYPNGKENPGSAINVTFNAMNRYVQWYTANYRADLYLEPIPVTSGHLSGFVFYDHLATGTWVGDGVYDEEEERTLHGVTVELWDASGTTLIATTTTGQFNTAATQAQGWHQPYTWPRDEFGGVFVGPLVGYYEFRDVAPGSYNVKVIPPAGFSPSPAGSDLVAVTVTGGARDDVNFGLNTTPVGSTFGVPLSGEIEGGVFDDVNVDPRGGSLTANPNDTQSLLFEEKAGIPGAPVGVYDHFGYLLGVGYMGNPLCYAGAPDIPGQPGVSQCPAGEDPLQKPEVERRFAPGVHNYVGNDPSLPGYCPNYLPLALPYKFGQGKYKFEADWSLVPVAVIDINNPCSSASPLLPLNAPVINNPGAGVASSTITLHPGDSFRITGENFGDRQGFSTVTLAGVKLKPTLWRDTYIDIVIPNDAMSGPLVVSTPTGISNALQIEISYSSTRAVYMAKRSVFVDASYTGPSTGSKTHPWRTISDALKHLKKHIPRFVFVAPGTYNEHVHIEASDVQLIGAGAHETIINGKMAANLGAQGNVGSGPVIHIGKGGKSGGLKNIAISGFTITGGTVNDDIGAGVFGDYGNSKVVINTCIIQHNGGYYGGGIWLHRSNHDVSIFSNVIAKNGNYGGYGGGISINDEPDKYEEEHGEPEHVVDDFNPGPPPGLYKIYNNLIYHNFSPDYGGGIALYELKDKLLIYGNMIVENKADDHGGGMFLEDTGPAEIYNNVFLRNLCSDDGGAISFEDVGDTLSHIKVYNNLFAENIADDRGENHARGGALAFDDTFYGEVYNNTITGNIVAGSYDPAGGGIDSERNGHEYNHNDNDGSYYKAPGYSDPKIHNNIIWNNWRLKYEQPGGEEEDLDYTWGKNYQWFIDELHVDNPVLQPEWQSQNNSESFTDVKYNDIRDGYSSRIGNLSVDPKFVDPNALDWHLKAGSPVISKAPALGAPSEDLDSRNRTVTDGMIDMGAYEWFSTTLNIVRIPTGILGTIKVPLPGSTSLYSSSSTAVSSHTGLSAGTKMRLNR